LSNERERKRRGAVLSSLAGKSAIPGADSLLVDLIMPKKLVSMHYLIFYVEVFKYSRHVASTQTLFFCYNKMLHACLLPPKDYSIACMVNWGIDCHFYGTARPADIRYMDLSPSFLPRLSQGW
jgi:hypothetical protein